MRGRWPLVALVVAAALAGGALLLIRRPVAVRPPGPTPDVPRGRRVVVIGGGFGGLHAVNKLRKGDVDVTLIDRRNFHLFQPLLYQVATVALSPGEIAQPLRSIFRKRRNVTVLLAGVRTIDADARCVRLDLETPSPHATSSEHLHGTSLDYDHLIVATGATHAYFGHPEWGPFRLGKTNPNFSTSGLSALIAQTYAATGGTSGLTAEDLADPAVVDFATGVESAVVHYGDTTLTFLNNLYRADQRGTSLTYV